MRVGALRVIVAVIGLGLGISILMVWSPWICPFYEGILFVCCFVKEIAKILWGS